MCQQATGELKLWLKFDTGMQDASGNGNNASCSGTGCPALLPTGGHDGKGAYLFDGIDDYLELPAAAGFGMQETNQYTITAWAKPNSANGNIMQKGQYFYPFMVQFTDGVVRAGTRTANTSYIYSNTSPATGQWHHLAVTYTNGERVLYINGVADNQDSPSGGLNVMGEKTTIGGWTNSSYFSGTIDDIRVYNTILGGAEILAIYQGTETECVDGTALANYLAQWKAGDISIPMLMQKIAQWKAGTGC
jgi:hypothetical protein